MEFKLITSTIKNLNLTFNEIDTAFFTDTLGLNRYNKYKIAEYLGRETNIINDTGGTRFYNYNDNYLSAKVKPCVLCGEYGEWRKDWSDVKHSKKNCPYKYIWGEVDIKALQKMIQICHKYVGKSRKNLISEKYNLKLKVRNMDISQNEIIKKCDKKCCEKQIQYDEKDKELKLFYRIMPVDTINEKKEQHNMMMEEQNQIKIKAENEKNVVITKIKKLKTLEQLLDINKDMRNVKIENLEHKNTILQEKLTLNANEYEAVFKEKYREYKKDKDIANATIDRIAKASVEKDIKLEEQEKEHNRKQKNLQEMVNGEIAFNKKTEKINEKLMEMIKDDKKICDKIENCSICLEKILSEDMELNCGHHFHSRCLTAFWLSKCRKNKHQRTYKCPNCRGEALCLNNYNQ